MNKIAPHIWFNQNAMDAAEFYVSVFDNSRIRSASHYFDGFFPDDFEGIPLADGTVLFVDFELEHQRFGAVNGGPIFHPNPSVSFYVRCRTQEQVRALWEKLIRDGGQELMALGKYPFNDQYGWLQDRFGVSWQLILAAGQDDISPCLMFTGSVNGRAEEAMNFYCSLFPNSGIHGLARYEKEQGGDEGTVMHAEFELAGQSFIAMDSSYPHQFGFNEGVSLMVFCKTQQEIDFFWDQLTQGGEQQPCGWLKDRFGLSWQIVPEALEQLTDLTDRERAKRVNHAMLKMKKIDLQALWDAYGEKD